MAISGTAEFIRVVRSCADEYRKVGREAAKNAVADVVEAEAKGSTCRTE